MDSLLGQFYYRIKGSQEDIATEGLAYILNKSPVANKAFLKIIKNECNIDFPEITFRTQVSGEKLERPDIVGTGPSLKEMIIIEAKFWHALTDNQPVEYMNRLSVNSVLLFICPSLRVRSLWDEVVRRITNQDIQCKLLPEKHIIIFSENCYVLFKPWNQVLNFIRDALVRNNEASTISDVDQVIGFCSKIDETTFVPIQMWDLSPGIGKRIYSYYSLIDKLVDELRKVIEVDLSGLRATPQYGGYTRFCKIKTYGIALKLDFKLWFELAETPFWIQINNYNEERWDVDETLVKKCQRIEDKYKKKLFLIDGVPHFPLFPIINEPENVILENMARDIVDIVNDMA